MTVLDAVLYEATESTVIQLWLPLTLNVLDLYALQFLQIPQIFKLCYAP